VLLPSFPQFFEEIAGLVPTRRLPEFDPGPQSAPWVSGSLATDVESGELVRFANIDDADIDDDAWPAVDPAVRSGVRRIAEATGWADAIATYRPWNFFGDAWGITVDGEYLAAFCEEIADQAQVPAPRIAPWVLQQVLEHEYTHFSFEVAAMTVEDLLGEPRYVSYCLDRFGAPNRWSSGPLEEAVATFAELEYAASLRPRRGTTQLVRAYRDAVHWVNLEAPKGYRDFHRLNHPRDHDRIVADLMAAIADRTVWSGRWWPGFVSAEEKRQVPLRFVGSFDQMLAFGLLPKSLGQPSIAQFEAWVKAIGGSVARGGKHWKATLPNGRKCAYKKPSKFLLPPEAKCVAKALELGSARDLYEHVTEGSFPPAWEPVNA
jgi:hypothetical protein